MPTITTKGQCATCKSLITTRSARQHLEKCAALATQKENNCFLVKVHGPQAKIFWIYIAVPFQSTLSDLDFFLRELWLECCGHMSAFDIAGVRYEDCKYEVFGQKPPDLKINVAKMLQPGITFTYEYDFGTTTQLWLEVIDQYTATSDTKINLLMRNEMPTVTCSKCQEIAKIICSLCFDVTCKKCQKKHQCEDFDGQDCFLPFVNSPRTGLCGFTG